MEEIKLIIEIRGGSLIAVDFDQLDAGGNPVGSVMQPDIITKELHTIYGGNPVGDEVVAELKRIHF